MAAGKDGGITATAEVVKGGNKTVEIRVPVAIADRRGHPWWLGSAVARLDLPAGMELPHVFVPPDEVPTVVEVPREG